MNPQLLIFALVAAASFGAGFAVEGWRKDAQISRLERDHQAAVARAEGEAKLLLASAQIRNDRLATRLAAEEAARITQAQEKDHAIRRLTVGRPCLDGAVVRLLNDGANAGERLPQAGGESVSADAAFATDTDVGQWARHARDAYDTCRGRLRAIDDFYREQP